VDVGDVMRSMFQGGAPIDLTGDGRFDRSEVEFLLLLIRPVVAE